MIVGTFSVESVDEERGNLLFFSTLVGGSYLSTFWVDALWMARASSRNVGK